MPICECCGQTLPEKRKGVKLSFLKARIFDAVDRAGPDGIPADDLHGMVFTEGQKRATLKTHIWQINDVLIDHGYCIKAHGSPRNGVNYVLRKIDA